MGNLAERIAQDVIAEGCLGIYWLAQAGFVFKTPAGKIVYIDPYLSDVVERAFGFKRMMACPVRAEEVVADLVIATHEHLDHLDTDALPILARNPRTQFAGPVECLKEFRKAGILEGRCHRLEEGTEITVEGIRVLGVFADHGDFAPDAVGVILDFDGIQVYHTGDTAYRPEKFQAAIARRPQILLPCINGAYGNLNAEEAARLAQAVQARLVIAAHFWMFVEHGGDPGAFLAQCAQQAPQAKALVMKPGEQYIFRKS
jgi:L-ascorbate 6-phosphate lactonase